MKHGVSEAPLFTNNMTKSGIATVKIIHCTFCKNVLSNVWNIQEEHCERGCVNISGLFPKIRIPQCGQTLQ